MVSTNHKIVYLLFVGIFCLWLSSDSYAIDNDGMNSSVQWNMKTADLSNQDGEIELSVDEIGAYKPFKWGTDVQVASGTMEGGISITMDANFIMYAARCTTYNAITANAIAVYKSTDAGSTWQPFTFFYSSENASYTWPQLLTCNKGANSFLYVFSLRNDQNGSVRLRKYTLSGLLASTGALATGGTDTITYYSVCSNLDGDSLVVAYEWHQTGDETPNISTIRSLDYGVTWSDPTAVYYDGSQPDIAYSAQSRIFLVAREVDPEYDIHSRRSTNFGASWTEATVELTADADEDGFPKVAAEHDTLASGAVIWVVYNHYTSADDVDLNYAYSTNGGDTWTKNQVLAQSVTYNEVAGEIITLDHYTGWPYAFVCYLKSKFDIIHFTETSEIYFTYAHVDSASKWVELTKISDFKAAYSLDSREVCQEAMYPVWIFPNPGILYAGKTSIFSNFNDLYFDGYSYVDVEDKEDQTAYSTGFILSDNYPNPFNPETQIGYYLPKVSHVKLEIFNILGQRIRTVIDEDQTVGQKEITWNGTNEKGEQVASGVYFYRLQAKDFVQTKKMVLMR
jgi:hypothetical protein